MASKASWDLREGDEVVPGRSVVAAVGGGSRYEVFLVWDEDMYALAVAKLIRPDQAEEERALREMRAEADLLEALAHPVIVRGFDAVEGPRPHLLIEHLEGPSLRSLLRSGGPLDLQQLLPLAMHVAGALVFLAHHDTVHLDVKPDNIIMGVPPRLIDLSIARSLERAARTKGVIGTDAYLAPEQTGAPGWEGRIGPAADVWGLGATLHHCISGQRPFPRHGDARESDDPRVRFPQLTQDPRPLPGGLDPRLAELIRAMLRRDPDERPVAVEVVERLQPLVMELPRKISLSRRAGRPLA